ncbi:forkhead box transcription factor P [Cochliomyia hominivorax]
MINIIKIKFNIYINIWIIIKTQIKNNEMKHSADFRPVKKIVQVSKKYFITKLKNSTHFTIDDHLPKRRTQTILSQQKPKKQHPIPMEEHNESKQKDFLYKQDDDKEEFNSFSRKVERQFDKENYIKIYNYDNASAYINGNNDNNNNKNSKSFTNAISYGGAEYNDHMIKIPVEGNESFLHDFKENQKTKNTNTQLDANNQYNTSLFATYNHNSIHVNKKSSDNIEVEKVQGITAEGEDEIECEDENDNNSEARTFVEADSVNNVVYNKCKVNDLQDKEKRKENNITPARSPTSTPQPLAAYVDTQKIATTHVQNITQHLHQHHLVKDLEQQILQGQHINVNNLLDVAGSICAGPIGALCDMSVFSKLDCSLLGDIKDHSPNNQDFLAKKYYHPLYAHGVCRWPGCELPLEDMSTFVKHLKTEHHLDDRSTAQARIQMQVVSQLEMHLQKERDRLQAMMHHLYLTKHFIMHDETQEPISHIRYKNAIRSVSTTPDLNKSNNNSNDESDGTNDLESLLMSSRNISATRKRICDKSPLALAGGLPYMLERAGLDVQQEIQRNREFYKNADVRPPFTYASLIRQSIIESPDKQLTLNEIYNWFQNTFCYFRRNAATWKNAIRTNLSLHKCFVRYEDDFSSFWMVDDSEFVKRRHLSRGRPRKYEPSSSPNSNSQQFGNTITSTASNDAIDGSGVVNDIANTTTSPDSSTVGTSSRQRCSSNGSNIYNRSGNKNHSSENIGGNDDYDICEVSQRSPARNQNHINGGKQYCGSKQRHQLQGSVIGISIKSNLNHVASKTNAVGVVTATGNNSGVGGIVNIGSVGSLDVDNHNDPISIVNNSVEADDTMGYDFHTQNISNDAILNSPTASKTNNGRYSPNIQNMWSFDSALSDEVNSAEFSCINSDRYRNFVTGLQLQSLTQRHHFHQHKSTSHRGHPKGQQHQNALRNNLPNQQHDVRSLHQTHGYHMYNTNPEDHHQKMLLDQQNQQLDQDIFRVNAILTNTDKYFSHNIDCRNDSNTYKQETFNPNQPQEHLNIRHHPHLLRSELSNEEMTNHIYMQHHSAQEVEVKYTPPHKTVMNFESHTFNRNDANSYKRLADINCSNKTTDAAEEDSGVVDCDLEEVQRKRKKSSVNFLDYDDIKIKAETESELKNIDMPLRTKSY